MTSSPSTSVHETVPDCGCSSSPLDVAGVQSGASLTGLMVTAIVAAFDDRAPSVALAVKLSTPLKSAAGV